jgi:hypothetical protein
VGGDNVDFADHIAELARQALGRMHSVATEEATKSGLVMPFIQALGYDVFNPTEVVPEFTADIGERKGEKVDFAILKADRPIMLFECKLCGAELDIRCATQLQRYFHGVPDVKFGILTDGITYRFFSDLDRPNVMDSKPFFEVNLSHLQDAAIDELRRFSKPAFDEADILSTAGELKYTREIHALLRSEFTAPSENFVRLLTSEVYTGRFTRKVHDRFAPIVRQAFRRFINERLNETLETAKTLQRESAAERAEQQEPDLDEETDGIVTTADELQGFYIVKAILSDTIDLDRVTMRDVRSYCGIILDDNNRKPICRLHFNNPRRKYLGLFDSEKNEKRVPVKSLNEIYKYSDRLRQTAAMYRQ